MLRLRLLIILAILSCASLARAEPQVVVSIKPIHALTAAIMAGVGEPSLILKGAASPHGYALSPSDARALQNADLLIWVGPGLEGFLVSSLDSLAANATQVMLMEAEGLTLLPWRDTHDHAHHEGHGHHEDHAEAHHDDHHEDHHDDHAQHDEKHHGDHHDDHHDEHAHGGHHDDHHDDHAEAEGGWDNHIWLDPANAQPIVAAIVQALSTLDPANAALFQANAEALLTDIEVLDAEIGRQLDGLGETPFVVFHDAYQYFEAAYGLRAPLAVSLSPEIPPSAQRLRAIQEEAEGINCFFAEPQFSGQVVERLAEGLGFEVGLLDPLGANLEPGPAAYDLLLRQLADSLSACLSRR
jgi:zinc transport system substrate-binding protein